MLKEYSSSLGNEILEMATFKKLEFSSKFHKVVPVVIERYKKNHVPGSQNNLKFLVSGDMTVSQLVSIVRYRMKLSLNHGFHLLFNKGRTAVMMSQQLGEISSKYKDKTGILRFIFAAQNTFGCPIPRVKPIKSIFPGIEPNPFGAPEPSVWMEDPLFGFQDEEEAYVPAPDNSNAIFMNYIFNHISSPNNIPPLSTPLTNPTDLVFMNSNFAQTDSSLATNPDEPPSAISSDEVPMEVSGPDESPPAPLPHPPLSLLIQSLNHLVPIWHIQFQTISMPPGTLGIPIDDEPSNSEHSPLVNSLIRLVEALQTHMSPSVQDHVPPLQLLPPPVGPGGNPLGVTSHYIPSIFINPPAPTQSGSNPPSNSSTPINHGLQALNLATQTLATLQNQTNIALYSAAESISGITQFTMLAQYFHQVSQNLEFQNLIAASSVQVHSGPFLVPITSTDSVSGEQIVGSGQVSIMDVFLPTPVAIPTFISPTSNLYHTDSDSLSEEEVDLEYFCDILL